MTASSEHHAQSAPLQLWGGLECTINRVGERFHSQLARNGHPARADDIARFAALGIKAIRYPVLWEQVGANGMDSPDWTLADASLAALRGHGVEPILGLIHHGSGPAHTSLVDPGFATGLADYAALVARRYPWAQYYTVVNEPLTTARFACLYGLWYPHQRSDAAFLRALLNQTRATVLAMAAIRRVNPQAKLVQTDDLGKTYATPAMHAVSAFYNERRWLGWDLLCGLVAPGHALYDYCLEHGVDAAELAWFRQNACPPDLIGVNYYVTSERWLDHRPELYPQCYRGMAGPTPCADIEAARALATPIAGVGPLLDEVWQRYCIPIAITEVHIDAHREDQLRWLLEVWQAAEQARQRGIDVRAVTVWSLLGAFDWNSLVTAEHGYYEAGPFDLRGPSPRPTALAAMMGELAAGKVPSHPVLHGKGWWRRQERLRCAPVATGDAVAALFADGQRTLASSAAPILISGASGTLGQAFARHCRKRNLSYHLASRAEMDIADPASVAAALDRYRPWALVNASGYVRVDDAEDGAGDGTGDGGGGAEQRRCLRENADGPAVLAEACAARGIHFTTFSSDLVFDGAKNAPYVESDATAPLNVYGRSKVLAERVLDRWPDALVVRTGAFFGPWDSYNFVTLALAALARGEAFTAASDLVITPTYVPDLVDCCLDLMVDRERGIWHLSNGTAVSWSGFAALAARLAGVDSASLVALPAERCGYRARRPPACALASERAQLMPPLEDALRRYLAAPAADSAAVEARFTAQMH